MRPVVPTLATIGGSTQVRMVAQPRPTTITRHSAPVRIQGPITVPRLANASVSQIRTPSGATIIQQHPGNLQIQSNPPALHPVSQNAFTAPGGAHVRIDFFLFLSKIWMVNQFVLHLDSCNGTNDSSASNASCNSGVYKTTKCGCRESSCCCCSFG